MQTLGIKFLDKLSYETFERWQYLLDYEMDYDDLNEAIEEGKIITLDMEDQDPEEWQDDIAMLKMLLSILEQEAIGYALYHLEESWQPMAISKIL